MSWIGSEIFATDKAEASRLIEGGQLHHPGGWNVRIVAGGNKNERKDGGGEDGKASNDANGETEEERWRLARPL